jgi:hypothetical protein
MATDLERPLVLPPVEEDDVIGSTGMEGVPEPVADDVDDSIPVLLIFVALLEETSALLALTLIDGLDVALALLEGDVDVAVVDACVDTNDELALALAEGGGLSLTGWVGPD